MLFVKDLIIILLQIFPASCLQLWLAGSAGMGKNFKKNWWSRMELGMAEERDLEEFVGIVGFRNPIEEISKWFHWSSPIKIGIAYTRENFINFNQSTKIA
jgi:hypothetical protein